MSVHFASGTWPEHSEDLQSIIFGQAVLQYYKDAAVISPNDLDADKLNDLVLKHPLNVTRTKLNREQCQKLWQELIPEKLAAAQAVNVKLQLLRQVKLYIEKGFQTLGEAKLVNLAGETTEEIEKSSNDQLFDGTDKSNKQSGQSGSTTYETSRKEESEGQPKSDLRDQSGSADAGAPTVKKISNEDIVDERIARRKSRTRRSLRSTPDHEDLKESESIKVEHSEVRGLNIANEKVDTTKSDLSNVVSPNIDTAKMDATKADLVKADQAKADQVKIDETNEGEKKDNKSSTSKRRHSEDENIIESIFIELCENPKFALLLKPIEHPCIKQRADLTAILQAVRDRTVKTSAEIHAEVSHLIANAVFSKFISSKEASALFDLVQDKFRPLQEIEENSKDLPRKRRR